MNGAQSLHHVEIAVFASRIQIKSHRAAKELGFLWNYSHTMSEDTNIDIAHILPVSDDGGSTAEIVRVLGGPAVGDIRSRCLRLSDVSTPEAVAVKKLLQHRLPRDRDEARAAWAPIVEGTDPLWESIESPYKHTIRAFLIHFHTQVSTCTHAYTHAASAPVQD